MTDAQRDTQRSAVYAAEDQVARILDRSVEFPVTEIAGSHITVPVERHFADLPSVQAYVDAVLQLRWVRTRWPAAMHPLIVRERRGAARAHYEPVPAVIAVPLHQGNRAWALREMVLLHEIAHHLTGDGDTGHGPSFTGRMVELVDGIIGPEAALLLRVTFADQGVRIG